ncbi:MAG: putative DsbA family dithiol-disulfide isomerase [Myxococcota bacterium]|jgi:predicted DsbA family dithiol-disulfide isomerase
MNHPEHTIPLSYWSDPLCVWAFVAQDKLDRLLKQRGDILAIDYRVIPVFGSVPHRFREGAWASVGPEGRAEATRRVAAMRGHDTVTGQVWIDDPPASSWSAGMAIKAVMALEAAEQAAEGAGASYQRQLRQCFFEDNCNVARRSAQLEVAERMALPIAALEELLDDGRAMALLWEDHLERERLKLRGSPTYVFDGGRVQLYGNFNYAILDTTINGLAQSLEAGSSNC